MEDKTFDKIVAVAGSPGLYFVVGQRPNGLILEEVGNPAHKFATSARQKVSVLADITMFTEDDDTKLGDVFIAAKALTDKGEKLPSKKDDDKAVKAGFEKVLPKYDKDRVYTSDMKKMFGWFHILKDNFDFSLINKVEETEAEADVKAGDVKKTKAKKKASGSGVATALAVIAGAAAAVVAGGVYLYGKNGAKNRTTIKSWALRAKADVIDAVQKTEDLTQEKYHKTVDAVMGKYQKAQDNKKKDLADLASDLKDHWKEIAKQVSSAKKKVSTTAKKSVKKLTAKK